MNRRLIISDLDGTLLGNPDAIERFRDWHLPRRERVLLAYSSGRSYASIAQSIHDHRLPWPVAVIGEVGTDIRFFPAGESAVNWPKVGRNWSPALVKAALGRISSLELQPEVYQSPFKVSYYYERASAADLEAIFRRLSDFQLEVEIVYSSNRDLDVLPQGVNKGAAANHLAGQLGLTIAQTIACGDSGNDASMFMHGRRSIVVSNAQNELKSLLGDHIYYASAPYADGVLEGLDYWLGKSTNPANAAIHTDRRRSTPDANRDKPE